MAEKRTHEVVLIAGDGIGPAITVAKNQPVRLLFRNLLPVGLGGNLFIPTDVTVMGSGMGPALGGMIEPIQTFPMCGDIDPVTNEKPEGCFTENRAVVHLHGGVPAVDVQKIEVSSDSTEMLEQDLAGEMHAIHRYRERIAEAEALREYGLRRVLEDILIMEEEHARDLETVLGL